MNTDNFNRKIADTIDEKSNHEENEAAQVLTNLGISSAPEDKVDEEEDDFEIPQRYTKSGRKRAVSFPLKLMKVLSNKEFGHVIHWMPSGKSFTILKPKAFAAEILPGHFKSAKYSSFTRKLHRWGFARHYKGDEAGAFYHKHFQRNRSDLVEQMTCLKAGEPTPVAIKSDAAPSSSKSSSAIVSSAVHESALRQASMPAVASGVPSVVGRTSETTPARSAQSLLLSHRPLLNIPVPKQQLSCQLLPTQSQLGLNLPDQSALVAAKINAAIELEVSRRLQERITAAAAQMSHLPPAPFGALNGLMTQPPAAVRRPVPINAAPSSHETLRMKLMQMQQQKEQMQYLAMTGAVRMPSQGLDEMPKTNIQGAKTA